LFYFYPNCHGTVLQNKPLHHHLLIFLPVACQLFVVSNIQGPSVAISRLKSHFKNKHLEELGPDGFAFESIYSPIHNACQSVLTDGKDSSLSAAATPPRKKRSPHKGGESSGRSAPAASEAVGSEGVEGGSSPAADPGLLREAIHNAEYLIHISDLWSFVVCQTFLILRLLTVHCS